MGFRFLSIRQENVARRALLAALPAERERAFLCETNACLAAVEYVARRGSLKRAWENTTNLGWMGFLCEILFAHLPEEFYSPLTTPDDIRSLISWRRIDRALRRKAWRRNLELD